MTSKGKSSKQKTKKCVATTSTSATSEENERSPEELQEQFERELCWCIDQLQLGLETQNPDSRRAQEAVKVMKILTSSKAPVIKKRQVMRNTFGDYRKKMLEEEKKSTARAKKMKLSSMTQSEIQKSQFFKKSSSKLPHKQSSETSQSENAMNDSFKFNFPMNKDSDNQTDANKLDNSDTGEPPDVNIFSSDNGDDSAFTFVKSCNDFKFNFALPDDT